MVAEKKPTNQAESEQRQQHQRQENEFESLVGSEIFIESEHESVVTAPGDVNNTAALEAKKIAPSEAESVARARFLVYIAFVGVTALVAAGVYMYAHQAEVAEFDDAFDTISTQIIHSSEAHLSRQLGAMESLGVSITSYYTSITSLYNSSWPFVTIADFERRGDILRNNGQAESVVLLPIITSMQIRSQWESYVLDQSNQKWIEQGSIFEHDRQERTQQRVEGDSRIRARRARYEEVPTVNGVASEIFTSVDGSNHTLVVDTSSPPFLPAWQSSPVMASWINFNFAQHRMLVHAVDEALQSKQAVLSKMMGLNNTWSHDEVILSNGATSPFYSLLYPLFDGFRADPQLVGLLSAQAGFQSFLEASAPSNSGAVHAVIENTCGQAITYRVQGDQVKYVGSGSQHDPRFNSWEHAVNFSNIEYDGEQLLQDVESGGCDYTMRIYPTQDMEDEYLTSRPLLYVVVIAALFSMLCIAFSGYDILVGRHRRAIEEVAIKARTIVTSLFPTVVHDRLFETAHTKTQASTALDQRQEQHRHVPPSEVSFTSDRSGLGGVTSSGAASMVSSTDECNSGVEPDKAEDDMINRSSRSLRSELLPMHQLRNFLQEGKPKQLRNESDHSIDLFEYKKNSAPIADLFPSVTVLFADISGFTAWSSVRDPAQVFMLLETIYRSFDRIARKRVVFKVETIGDCYVAVTGLPDPQPDHAVIMVKFAQECMRKMNELTRKLEVSLGEPETANLCIRCGLHSGPVTAGVLRGEKSRFQLFGDTVNTAARMESTGQRNRIQLSQATADFLIEAGREDWIQRRDDLVNAKGKGTIQTYWVVKRSGSTPNGLSSGDSTQTPRSRMEKFSQSDSFVNLLTKKKNSFRRDGLVSSPTPGRNLVSEGSRRSLLSSTHSHIWGKDNNFSDSFDGGLPFGAGDISRQERLIDWNVDILTGLLKRIVAQRRALNSDLNPAEKLDLNFHQEGTVLDEITEIIALPQHPPDIQVETEPEEIELDEDVESQLREYVTMVACMYRDNFFHNFEHASHVTMAAQKLLKRVLIADHERESLGKPGEASTTNLIDYTYGITSDPLTQFAVVFSALIHDVDHTGVPNSQLIKEKAHIASVYKDRSVAEQNSFDLSWDLLADSSYGALHRAIFANNEEIKYFRQLVVNVVLATDIFDKDMKAIRNSRFEKAFHKDALESPLSDEDERNLKTTIVIEYIMQASDVSHTMQHWHIYQQWNERLFEEQYSAWRVNRGEKDPSIGWYKGELWFFDNYIIPLAKKLKECGAFGAASDECLNYALANRKEWEARGEEIVQVFISKQPS